MGDGLRILAGEHTARWVARCIDNHDARVGALETSAGKGFGKGLGSEPVMIARIGLDRNDAPPRQTGVRSIAYPRWYGQQQVAFQRLQQSIEQGLATRGDNDLIGGECGVARAFQVRGDGLAQRRDACDGSITAMLRGPC